MKLTAGKVFAIGLLLLVGLLGRASPAAAGTVASQAGRHDGRDPWARLRQVVTAEKPAAAKTARKKDVCRKKGPVVDPWVLLRQVVIPFALELERESGPENRGELARIVDRKLAPWQAEITRAARYFEIPEAIIKAVIMVESGGDPRARAGSTSAAGLMQTISSTFAAARRDLITRGVMIADDPFDPASSIMAGSWYLDRMFDQAVNDGKPGVDDRLMISSWRYPLEYYYAGPGHGRKAASRVLIYRDGKRVVIDKKAYSGKVLGWAGKLQRTRTSRLAAGGDGGAS